MRHIATTQSVHVLALKPTNMLPATPAILLVVLLASPGAAAARATPGPERLDDAGFRTLLERLARGWNEGDAAAASRCFAADAVYVEPPRKQVYLGRDALFEFFGGSEGRPGAMSMTWRNIVFDAEQQLGMAEFTFSYGGQVHGVAVIRVRAGVIQQWREYWYESELDWTRFVEPGQP